MTTMYINEAGVRPWESMHPTDDARFTTTTLLARNFSSVWNSWCDTMDLLSEEWPIKKEWTSTTTISFNSKAEEYLFKKNITATLGADDLFKKNEKTNIYSTIKNHSNSSRKIQNLVFEGSHNALLIVQKSETSVEELWIKMTIFEKLITPEKISTFLDSQANILLCRFYESETHATAQLMYKTTSENKAIIKNIRSLFKEISIKDIHHYINGTKAKN
ncbi:hypothetical protein RJC98_07740 [Pseudomonas allii]|uniref:Uncharacterized protein n=2 Tax=Pseudomonas allii TaxID=2740531 RepID=A0ACC6L9C8_9PSED|nr:hypothetical protein [Pseudomonas allii]MDR9875068.1 hypothetical protein [Pseudomonas allii]NWN63983.1 hypothetical protein [Pseudomonas allii]